MRCASWSSPSTWHSTSWPTVSSLDGCFTFFDHDIPEDRILSVLEELELGDWFRSLPEGLNTEIATGGHNLSAGEAQLLAFARIFLRDPALVILDEASSRLDPATEQRIERAADDGIGNVIVALFLEEFPQNVGVRCLEQILLALFEVIRQIFAELVREGRDIEIHSLRTQIGGKGIICLGDDGFPIIPPVHERTTEIKDDSTKEIVGHVGLLV